jgi:hypothetical protein
MDFSPEARALPAAPAVVVRPQLSDDAACHGGTQRCAASMLGVFRTTGGLLSADFMAVLLRRHSDQPLSRLAHWIVRREVLTVPTCGHNCLPMFQFDPITLTVRPAVRDAIAELKDVFDNAELLAWFAEPNPWLDGRPPAQTVRGQPGAVVQAARSDRFVATGW